MAEFKQASLWLRLAFLFTVIAWALYLFSTDTSDWANHSCGFDKEEDDDDDDECDFFVAVQAMKVIGYIFLLTSTVLILCLVLLDELKGNKPALICHVVFSFISAVTLIGGVAIYEDEMAEEELSAAYATMICVIGAIFSIIGGIFGILELVGTKA